MTRDAHEPLDLLDDQVRYRMLCRFEKHNKDYGGVIFVDTLPPFGVVEIADSTWQDMGEPRELRVTLEVIGG